MLRLDQAVWLVYVINTVLGTSQHQCIGGSVGLRAVVDVAVKEKNRSASTWN
jgi:hypothetical protein